MRRLCRKAQFGGVNGEVCSDQSRFHANLHTPPLAAKKIYEIAPVFSICGVYAARRNLEA